MVPSLFAGLGVLPAVFLRENPLPSPFLRGVGIFSVQGVGQKNAATAIGKVASVDRLDAFQVFLKRTPERPGQHGDTVLRALAVADEASFPDLRHSFSSAASNRHYRPALCAGTRFCRTSLYRVERPIFRYSAASLSVSHFVIQFAFSGYVNNN